MEQQRVYRAGDFLQDLCRACKTVRDHTVIVADPGGAPLRVICDFCGSQHNYRGGETRDKSAVRLSESSAKTLNSIISERERSFPAMSAGLPEGNPIDLELMLRRVIREEAGITAVTIADKWRGGELILRPGRADLQEKSWPIETFFHKVVMLRNRLRVLEQQVNSVELPEDVKIKLQGYITGCYGTLTSFNILFAEEEDRFHGSAAE
jgi:hypothetical protein